MIYFALLYYISLRFGSDFWFLLLFLLLFLPIHCFLFTLFFLVFTFYLSLHLYLWFVSLILLFT